MLGSRAIVFICSVLPAVWGLNVGVLAGAASGQSGLVFMTADYFPAGVSKLVRFDEGVETFAVNAGDSPAFLGATILNGEVLVANYRNDAIQRFSPDGVFRGNFAVVDAPTFLESDSSGNVYTTRFSLGAGAVRFDSSGAVTGTFAAGIELAGIDADAAGNVYVVAGNTLRKYAPDGTFLNSIPAATGSPLDISIDEVGELLYMAHEFGGANGITIYDIAGATPTFMGAIARPAGSNLIGIHFAAESGNILATDFGVGSNDPRGFEFSPSGVLLREYRPAGAAVALDIVTLFVIPEPHSAVLAFVAAAVVGSGPGWRRRKREAKTVPGRR